MMVTRLVDMAQRSRLLKGEVIGVEMSLERGQTVEVVGIGHHLLVRLYGGQHRVVVSGDRMDSVFVR